MIASFLKLDKPENVQTLFQRIKLKANRDDTPMLHFLSFHLTDEGTSHREVLQQSHRYLGGIFLATLSMEEQRI